MGRTIFGAAGLRVPGLAGNPSVGTASGPTAGATSRCRTPLAGLAAGLCAGLSIVLGGCSDPEYDTSTPERTVQSARRMIEDGRPDLLPGLLHLQPRDIRYDDGVTEASAIQDVKAKTGEMLGQLWRVAGKLKERFPSEVSKEAALAVDAASAGGGRFGRLARRILTDPMGVLDEQMLRLEVLDLGDGTAAVTIDDEPAFGGTLAMVEVSGEWRFTVPVELARSSGWWPDTREEWAVVASMMLGIENSLRDFERELDRGRFQSLREASERAGRIVGESVVAQSVIYAFMKRKDGRAG